MFKIKKILIPIFAVVCLFTLSLAITGCGKGLAKKLDMPLNVTIEINQRGSGTQYILNWDEVEGAKGYSLDINGRPVTVEKNTLDATDYVTPGQHSSVHIKALGNGISTGDSDLNKAAVPVEVVSANILIFKVNEDEKSASVLSFAAEKSQLAGKIVIPDYYNGLPITEIGDNAFFDNNASFHNPMTGQNCNDMTSSFRLPKKLEKIGDYAFAFCTKVRNMNLPSTVKYIGEGSFLQCIRLTTINLNEVKNFGLAAFAYCKALNSVELSENISTFDAQVFLETPVVNNIVGDKILNGNILYEVENKELEKYTIPEKVTCIAGGAFMNCKKLTSIIIPENVKLLGSRIFAGCESLGTVNIPKNATEIYDFTFAKTAIKEITIPKTVTYIGIGAFSECLNLTTVELPENLTEIRAQAFHGSGITSITLPESLKIIGEQAFRQTFIEEITIPDNVVTIGEAAFYYCQNLKILNLGKGIIEIGSMAFIGCPISNATVPKGVTTLEEYVFGENSLSYVVVHNRINVAYQNSVYKLGCRIYYEGTKEEFEQIKIMMDDNPQSPGAFTASNVRFYSEEKPSENLSRYWRWVDGVPTEWTQDAQ